MKESLLTYVFWHAGFFLVLAALIIPLLRYFKIPIALGYLLAGIALGPYALGALAEHFPWLEVISLKEGEHVQILAELGIVLLLFVIGLEITPRRLWQMRSLVFGLGGAQVLISAFVIGGVAFFWGNTIQVSILLGLGLALSSTAMGIQWLHERKLFSAPVGRASFSILLLQDIAVIPILLLLTILSADIGDDILQFTLTSLLKMGATVLAIYFVGKIALKPIFVFANRYGGSEVFMALCLLVVVASASVASLAGLSMALGAFIAGLLLADTEYRHEISSLIIPFKSMLIGIFFLSFGMGINLSFITEKPFWLFASFIGLMVIKASIIFALCKLWKQNTSVAAESAILLSQAGEFGLLVVGTALTVGLMEQSVGQFMLITIGMTMLVTPLIAPLSRKVGKIIEEKTYDQDSAAAQSEELTQHIPIFGFGRVGQNLAESLSKEGYTIIGFDKNVQNVDLARKVSCPVFLGDAAKKSTLKAAHLEDAICAAVTLDDPQATKNIVKAIRGMNDSIPIIVRAHTGSDLEGYKQIENVDAVAEDLLVSAELSEKILNLCGNYNQEGSENS